MHDVWLDMRFALRGIRRRPLFAVVIILTLALGIGVQAAIFALVDTALLRPLGYPQEERIVSIGSQWSGGFDHSSVSIPEYLDYSTRTHSFEAMAAWRQTSVNLDAGTGDPENVQSALVTAGFLDVLGLEVRIGRWFAAREERPGAEPVVILSHDLWARRFGSNPAILGSRIEVDGETPVVIGIMPTSVRFPSGISLWMPLRIDPADPGNRSAHNRNVFARLAPAISIEQARREMNAMAKTLAREHPEDYPKASGWGISVLSLRDLLVGDMRTPLLVLMAAVAVLLLIACANVTNLMLAQLSRRHGEMLTRGALGAPRSRLVRQILTESVLLGGLGGAAGLALTGVLRPALLAVAPSSLDQIGTVAIDWRVQTFAFGTAVMVAMIFGLVSSAAIPRATGQRDSGARVIRSLGTRQVLIVAEVGLAFLLLVGCGLLVRTFVNLITVEPGLDPDQVMTARISLSRQRYPDEVARTQFFDRLFTRLQSDARIEHAGAASLLPLTGTDTDFGFGVEGWEAPTPGAQPDEQARVVTPGYFQTLRIPLRRGRTFDQGDTAESPAVVVVSESLARKYWPGAEPIGRRIRLWGLDAEGPWRTVVGVVGDVRHFGLGSEPPPILYFPLDQLGQRSMSIVVRGPGVSAATIGEVSREIDPQQAVYAGQAMKGIIDESLAAPKLNLSLLSLFSALALVLAAIGIYGVVSSLVSQRTRELGVRLALGATPGWILRHVLGRGMLLAVLGVTAGAITAIALTRFLGSLLFGVSPLDPLTWLTITGAILLVTAVACGIPARRATRIEPGKALREF